ncbi:MAG: peptidase C45 [Acidobacteria bacterium]|nr:peptidase C45 [Acidobacteriota bacterium]
MRCRNVWLAFVFAVFALLVFRCGPAADPRLKQALRKPEQNGWIFVHLEGNPSEIGFQHGYLLAPEIADAQKVIALELTHDTQRDWAFFRTTAQEVLWPQIEQEYRDELNGIVEGLRAKGVNLDIWDVVAFNAWLELPGYSNWLKKQSPSTDSARAAPVAERCSAFVAAGSYTKDGGIVIGHNAWTNYLDGERWNIIFDIVPAKGHRILMDGFPGLIHSADDFGINAAGIMITETTITGFSGWDPNGVAEFVRARKAMQYSSSIDDFARIMSERNNGGYANNWLVGDRKSGEIASLELGLKNVNLRRTKDGYFGGANFPVDEKLTREETDFNPNDPGISANARRLRWEQLMAEYKGKIDVEAGKRFLSDHYDTYEQKAQPNERTLCGHVDLSPRGMKPWQQEYGPAGAVQAKVTDSAMAGRMALVAAMGHSCGIDFKAAEHLANHPQFSWQKEFLRDLNSHPWTEFTAQR